MVSRPNYRIYHLTGMLHYKTNHQSPKEVAEDMYLSFTMSTVALRLLSLFINT